MSSNNLPSDSLRENDPQLWDTIVQEEERQRSHLELIASENFVSPAVLGAVGTVLTNKYAEGYVGRRYYGGCEKVDLAETLAIDRAKRLFGAAHANVQPHAGSQANMACYFAAIDPGQTVLAMDLTQGGHLTHGAAFNFSGMLYQVVSYGVDPDTERIDMDRVRELAVKHRPAMIVAGATAYSRVIDFQAFADIARQVGAVLMADIAHIAGLIAGGAHPSPVGLADLVAGTTHKTLRGPRGGFILTSRRFARKIDRGVFPGIQGGPLMHVIAAKAVAFGEALRPDFREYARRVVGNTALLCDELAARGHRIVSGGTDNHLFLVDLANTGLTGREAEHVLGAACITVNKNAIPFDKRPPVEPSGIRLGTAALTTRGMDSGDMKRIAGWIDAALRSPGDAQKLGNIRETVREFAQSFPLHAWPGCATGATDSISSPSRSADA